MTDRKKFSLDNVLSVEFNDWLKSNHPSAKFVLPNSINIDNIFKKLPQTSILVTLSDSAHPSFLTQLSYLHPAIPVLILGEFPDLLSSTKKTEQSRIIDFIELPVSEPTLSHRLRILKRVRQLFADNLTYATSFDRQLTALTTRDSLTGLYNRHHLTTQLLQALEKALNHQEQLALLIFNIDYFHRINQTNGLEFGDAILNEIAARLTKATRKTDTCYRFSGEDFVVVMPGADSALAQKTAKKISRICTERPFHSHGKSQFITLSIGIASMQNRPKNINEFITMAETALFLAKAEGRNRISIYSAELPEGDHPCQQSIKHLRQTFDRILEKTRISVISSLQLLASNTGGPEMLNRINGINKTIALLGEQMHLPQKHIETLQNAVAIQTCFKLLFHADLVAKPGNLSQHEMKTIKDLPFRLAEFAETFDYFANERKILESYGERYDGGCYPFGLKGSEIPLGSRIFNIVDSLIAMNSERPYRRKLAAEEIVWELKNEAGKQFDPTLVMHLFAILEQSDMLPLDAQFLTKVRQELCSTFPELNQ
jgi:diguanylate cyclase (GGDEF)-like protein